MQGFEKRAQLLSELGQTGSLAQYGAQPELFSYQGAGRDVAASLMQFYVLGEMSLERFGVLLNNAAQVGLPQDELLSCVDNMNRSYISSYAPTQNLQGIYDQMAFFDGCVLSEAQTHLDNMANSFISLCLAQKTVPKQAVALLNAQDLSPRLAQVKASLLGALQANARGSIAGAPSPQDRVKIAIRIASRPAGSLIIDQAIWDDLVRGSLSAVKASPAVGAEIRMILTRASEGELLDKPKLTLERINDALYHVEKALSNDHVGPAAHSDKRDPARVEKKKRQAPKMDSKKVLLYVLAALIVIAFIIGMSMFSPSKDSGKNDNQNQTQGAKKTPEPTKAPEKNETSDEEKEESTSQGAKKTPKPEEEVIILPDDDVADDAEVPDEEHEAGSPSPTPSPSPSPSPTASPEPTPSDQAPPPNQESPEPSALPVIAPDDGQTQEEAKPATTPESNPGENTPSEPTNPPEPEPR